MDLNALISVLTTAAAVAVAAVAVVIAVGAVAVAVRVGRSPCSPSSLFGGVGSNNSFFGGGKDESPISLSVGTLISVC